MAVAVPTLESQLRLVFFHSSLSGQCRRVEGYLAQVLQRRRNHGTFKVVPVAEEERPDLLERFKVHAVPTLVVVQGKSVARTPRATARLPRDRRVSLALASVDRTRDGLGFDRMPGRNVPFPPMEAQLVKELPPTNGWQFEPKWDGFRGVLENDGGELCLWSRNERPLLRYFPELRPLGDLLPPHSALDGEIVIARDGVLDFDSMQTRLHPAESRIRKLSAEIPAEFIVFDVLLWDGKPVHKQPLEERRVELEKLEGFRLSPTTADVGEAQKWLDSFEAAGLDGVIAKRLGLPYLPGSRDGVAEGEAAQDSGLRDRRRPLEGEADANRDTAAGLVREGRKIDYVGSAAVAASRHNQIFERIEPLLKGATERAFSEPQPLGRRRARAVRGAAGARRRGALRQGAGQPLPPRLQVHSLPRRQGSGAVHVARGQAAPAEGRPDLRETAQASSRQRPLPYPARGSSLVKSAFHHPDRAS